MPVTRAFCQLDVLTHASGIVKFALRRGRSGDRDCQSKVDVRYRVARSGNQPTSRSVIPTSRSVIPAQAGIHGTRRAGCVSCRVRTAVTGVALGTHRRFNTRHLTVPARRVGINPRRDS